ncbi:MAG: fumarylacetoacetate hydrolase family protein [Ardenticatenia bacterium]|nr:fumarylacetoacetate hydrolase family protein [Ardenticatenia bacterium]
MNIVRFAYRGLVATGVLDGEDVYRLDGDVFREWQRGTHVAPLSEVQLLAPVQPSKIVCVGRNYAAHAAEHNAEVPKEPLLFLKPPSAVIGTGEVIRLPRLSRHVEHEAELAVVIGRRCRHVRPDESAWDVVLGYTCANDVTARDLQFSDGQWTRAKGFDTFCPLGPWIVTDVDPRAVDVIARVNGEVRQHGNTRDMVFAIPHLIAAVTAVMTLEPGDVLLTGTPAGVGPLVPGDVVEIEVEGVGVLCNSVRAEADVPGD